MLSRVADSLYWMSRYLERAEHTARLLDVDLQLRLEGSHDSGAARWLRLLDALHAPLPLDGKVDSTALAHSLTFDRSNPSSIVSSIAAARENLRHVREQCSTVMWEQLNQMYLKMVGSPQQEDWLHHSHHFFGDVRRGADLFHGVTDSSMSHGEGWFYIQLGKYMERTDSLAALIGTHFAQLPHPLDQAVESEEYLEWVGLLRWCAAFEAYCKTYTAELRPLRVAEFLVLDAEFPHSIRFSIDMVHAALQAIGDLTKRKALAPTRITGRLRAMLNYSQIEEIMAEGPADYVEGIRKQIGQVHHSIYQIYFDYPVEAAMAS
jgi:uncharacterized alpha-E superfamily protein